MARCQWYRGKNSRNIMRTRCATAHVSKRGHAHFWASSMLSWLHCVILGYFPVTEHEEFKARGMSDNIGKEIDGLACRLRRSWKNPNLLDCGIKALSVDLSLESDILDSDHFIPLVFPHTVCTCIPLERLLQNLTYILALDLWKPLALIAICDHSGKGGKFQFFCYYDLVA